MNIRFDDQAPGGGQALCFFDLEEGDAVHLLHPGQIVAFQGASACREDRLMNIQGMYRKKKLIKSVLSGPSRVVTGLPPGLCLKWLPIEGGSDLLFEFRHLFFYTEGILMKSVVQTIKNMLITRDLMKMKFSGSGTIGILSFGPLHEMKLDPEVPLFLDTKCLVAYPENAKIELCVYGNHLASQHMDFQWKMTGEGYVLLQTAKPDPGFERHVADESLMRRVLREVIPFGGIFIK